DRGRVRLAGAAVEQPPLSPGVDQLVDLAVDRVLVGAEGGREQVLDGRLVGAVEHRGAQRQRLPPGAPAPWPSGGGPSWRPWSLDQPVSLAQPGRVSNDQPWAATQPRWVSSTWPMFIRLGTPSGLRMMSTGVPSARKGMSSSGRILEMTPLLPWRPASLSPS